MPKEDPSDSDILIIKQGNEQLGRGFICGDA
jgi:hypothetical protein